MAAPTKLSDLRIPLVNVREATNNFHDDNNIGGGTFGPIYKGQLFVSGKSIKIAARRLDRDGGFGDVEFWNEVTTLSGLNHPNLVSLIGYCDDEGEKVIITKHEAKGSLEQYLSNPNLTWGRRLEICVGVARALSHLRYEEGRDYGVIHLNVNTYTILLDENWEPKLSGFEISIKQPVNRMDQIILSEPIGERGYIDPAIERTKGVTDKSDVYSFGIVLCEILVGRLAYMEDGAEAIVAALAENCHPTYHACDAKRIILRTLMHPDLWDDRYWQSYEQYLRLAVDCVREERSDRLDMEKVVKKLEVLRLNIL